jgi:hypothetical protein
MSNQTTTRKDSSNSLGPIRTIKTVIRNHCPHWKRHVSEKQQGRAYVEFSIGDYAGLYTSIAGPKLCIDATERFEDEDTGRESAKRVMVTLDEEATRQLYAILHERFKG